MSDHTTTTLFPHLICRNASEAIEFYQKALGAEVQGVFKSPDGRVMNAESPTGRRDLLPDGRNA